MKDEKGKPLDLGVRTRRYALAIIKLSARCPRGEEALVIRRQMLRSGTSVGAHYREGYRARSTAEFVSKMEGALQELDETAYWLELLRDAGSVPKGTIDRYLNETEELIRIFVQCVKNAKNGE